MAKIAYSKLKKKVEPIVKTVEFNGEKIEVRQWISTQDRLALMGKIIELAHDESYHFFNPIQMQVFSVLETVKAYTNITFTEKQEEDVPKLYDEIICGGLWEAVKEVLPEEATDILWDVRNVAEKYYEYQNSMLGAMESIKLNYDATSMDVDALQEKIRDPETFGLVKEIMNVFATSNKND